MTALRRLLQHAIVLLGLAVAARERSRRWMRVVAAVGVVGVWATNYVRYRRAGRATTAAEYERLRSVDHEAFRRHYNERVPTVEQELDLWGPYHADRHLMRYALVEDAVRRHLPSRGRILDIGCGAALVADGISELDATYIGAEFADPLVRYAHTKYEGFDGPLDVSFVRSDATALPLSDGTVDIVVMSEVIEHLIRPELAVWEIARVLRPSGILVMTTNNASEMPLRSPVTHLFAWIEKAVGASVPSLVSLRPWIWPEPVDPDLVPKGSANAFIPHTHHISAETRTMFSAAGLQTLRWFTFEFPPPQSRSAAMLARMGVAGRVGADVIEAIARTTPGVRRLGTHLYIEAKKVGVPISQRPPAGIWPGPLSTDVAPPLSRPSVARAWRSAADGRSAHDGTD